MPTVAKTNAEDSAKIKSIEEKFLAHPELAALVSELGASVTDAGDLVRGLLQASINTALKAEMDAHLGYKRGDRGSKASNEQGNYRRWVLHQDRGLDLWPSRNLSPSRPYRYLHPDDGPSKVPAGSPMSMT